MENTAKTYYITYNVGKAKYLISFNDGIKKHPDGSNFFDIKTFKNKKLLNSFISQLEKDGYIYKY